MLCVVQIWKLGKYLDKLFMYLLIIITPLTPEFYIQILAHPVFKM